MRHALSEWVAGHPDASPAWTREYQDMALRCVLLEYNIDDLCFHLLAPGPWGTSFPGFGTPEGAVVRFLGGLEEALQPYRARVLRCRLQVPHDRWLRRRVFSATSLPRVRGMGAPPRGTVEGPWKRRLTGPELKARRKLASFLSSKQPQ